MMSSSSRPYGKTAICGSTFILVLLVLVLNCTTVSADPGELELVKLGHEVKSGETLDTIANLYLRPDLRGNEQAFLEFREGIYQLNFERVFEGRPKYEVRKKDFLEINLWAIVDYD